MGHSAILVTDMGGSPELASLLTGVAAISNGSSRLAMGFVCDRLGHKKPMYAVSVECAVAFALIALAIETQSLALLTAGFICSGISFGGVVPINTTVCLSFYGRENYAMNFSVITLHMIISSFLGPWLAGGIQTAAGSFTGVAVLMSLFGAAGLVLSFTLKKA
jgi:MFS family permease